MRGPIEVSTERSRRGTKGIKLHRRKAFAITTCQGIRVTTPIDTIVDIATCISDDELEAAIDEADTRDLVHPKRLRKACSRPGIACAITRTWRPASRRSASPTGW